MNTPSKHFVSEATVGMAIGAARNEIERVAAEYGCDLTSLGLAVGEWFVTYYKPKAPPPGTDT